jgi:hypothetical protein
MTAEEYLKEYYDGYIAGDYTLGEVIGIMQSFARLKCKEQREEVANELLNHEIDWGTPIKIDSQVFKKIILNSPEPEI